MEDLELYLIVTSSGEEVYGWSEGTTKDNIDVPPRFTSFQRNMTIYRSPRFAKFVLRKMQEQYSEDDMWKNARVVSLQATITGEN